jgi:iron(III) transport system ATP-binding protein
LPLDGKLGVFVLGALTRWPGKTNQVAPEPDLDRRRLPLDDEGLVALECRGLVKRFGNVPAVDGLDLTVPPGWVLALLGPSGCGKTTALRLIAGFEEPDAGAITLGGRLVCGPGKNVPPEKRWVGMVFQEGALFPHLTVEQNISYGLPRVHRRNGKTEEVLALVGLSGLGHRMPHELSGGQQQRVALGRALAPEPEVLLLDEPFSNLDPKLREQVRHDVMQIVRASGATAIFVTHDQEEALFVGDIVAVMNQGCVLQVGSPEDIFHSPASRFVAQFIGTVDFLPAWRAGDKLMTEVGSADWPFPTDPALAVGVAGAATVQDLEVMVRPDCLDCRPSEQGGGVITEREFRGAFYLYRVTLPSGHSVRCLASHTTGYPVGQLVEVSLRPGHSLRPFIDQRAAGC